MGSMKDFVQTCGYNISAAALPDTSCENCGYLWQKRIFGSMRNICGLYKKMRNDEVIIPNPRHAICKCHINKQR